MTLGKMEPLSKVFLARNQALAAEEGDFIGGGGAQRKSAQVRAKGKEEWNARALYVFSLLHFFPPSHPQPALPSDTEGSLWWHRNFAKGDDALFNAQWELIEYVPIGWLLVCLFYIFVYDHHVLINPFCHKRTGRASRNESRRRAWRAWPISVRSSWVISPSTSPIRRGSAWWTLTR